jgi:hypothetical protein
MTLRTQYALGYYLFIENGDKVKSKVEIEEEIKNVIRDIDSVRGESAEFIAHLHSTREALEWVLGD